MSLSSFALVIGVLCYVYGFPLVFCDEKHLQWRKKMLKDENMLRVIGTVLLAMSVTTLRYNWRLSYDGEGIVIVIVWLTFLKGLVLAWWPGAISTMYEKVEDALFDSSTTQMFIGFVIVLVGALFTFLGLQII